MRKVKPLSEYQKSIYGEILSEFFNPIFSTGTSRSLKNNDLEVFLPRNSDTKRPGSQKLTPSGSSKKSKFF